LNRNVADSKEASRLEVQNTSSAMYTAEWNYRTSTEYCNSVSKGEWNGRMPSSGKFRRAALVREDSEESIVSIIRVQRISQLGTMLAVTSK
jgi:hypothetical protein